MKQIKLSNSDKSALVDDSDFDELNRYRWHLHTSNRCQYARARVDGKNVLMHRLLLRSVRMIDHRDGNGLNNERTNLRIATQVTNQRNRRKLTGKCPHKGVQLSLNQRSVRYRARIKLGGRQVQLGNYSNPIAAAIAYDIAAKREFGEFARTNF